MTTVEGTGEREARLVFGLCLFWPALSASRGALAMSFSVALKRSSESSVPASLAASRNFSTWDFCFAMATAFDEFYKLIGISITQWAHVEDYLFMICQKCLRNRRYDLASIVYYRTPQLDSRIKLVDELIKANLPSRQKKNGGHDDIDVLEWLRVRKQLEDLLTFRRRIAHHPMRAHIDADLDDEYNIRIEQSFAEDLRGKGEALPQIKQCDIERHIVAVQSATGRLRHFHDLTLSKHIE
jgi:hypothetical protein